MRLSDLIEKAKAEQTSILESVRLYGGEEAISYKIDYATALLQLTGDIPVPEDRNDLARLVDALVGSDYSEREFDSQNAWIDAVHGLRATLG